MAKQKNQVENVFFQQNVFDLNQKHLLLSQKFCLLKNSYSSSVKAGSM